VGVALTAMLTLPGLLALTCGSIWEEWRGLQRWIVAVSLSIAFYPIFFYWTRSAVPLLTLGPYKMSALLLLCAALLGWRLKERWRDLFDLDQLEWVAVGIFAMTLFSRFWMIRGLPYPAWSDSLHHTLLTELTARQGRLPLTMEPYFPINLADYHLGLYALSGTLQWLARIPAHSALLVVSQVLNALCVAGVYLVVDRKANRRGALIGAVVVGLLSHQPAFYVNWGRFTQLSSQTVLFAAWLVTWEALRCAQRWWPLAKFKVVWYAVLAAVLSAAVFLLHFRVAVFYLPLLVSAIAWELYRSKRSKVLRPLLVGMVLVGALGALAAAPGAWSMIVAIAAKLTQSAASQTTAATVQSDYFKFDWKTVPILVAPACVLALAALATAWGAYRKIKLVVLSALWAAVLLLMGNAYRLGVPILNVTNLGAVLIMLYLPIGLVIGAGGADLLQTLVCGSQQRLSRVTLALVVATGFVGAHLRTLDIEPFRYFVTQEDALAMNWIADNTPPDALFAVNTYFWFDEYPHGTDAGYWIPYFSNRQMTSGVMLLSLAPPEYRSHVVRMSKAAEQLAVDGSSLSELQALGVDYVYVGARGDFSGDELNLDELAKSPDLELVYRTPHVGILRIEVTGD